MTAAGAKTTPWHEPEAPRGTVPVKLIAPLPFESVAPSKLIPFDPPVVEADAVPISVIVPVPAVLIVPEVKEIPVKSVLEPVEDAVIAIVPPEEAKFAVPLKPYELAPEPPTMPVVAVMEPPVEKADCALIA